MTIAEQETIAKLQSTMTELRDTLIEQQKRIKELSSPPFLVGTVAAVKDALVTMSTPMGLLVVPTPPKATIQPGMCLYLQAESKAIVAVSGIASVAGIGSIKRIVDASTVEVHLDGSDRICFCSQKVQEGDRVGLDETNRVVVKNFGKPPEFEMNHDTNVSWDDIGGLAKAKAEMREAIELPHKHKDLFTRYGKKPMKGILLYGPPGNGKTMLAKAAATSLAKLHGQKTAKGFVYVKGPEVLNMYVGNSEAAIRRLFAQTREHHKKHGYPAVLFIDEADALFGRRGSQISSDVNRTIVPMFLSEMDGLEESGAFVLLATNRPDTLDTAVVRDGRIDRKVHVPRPDRATAEAIFTLHMKGRPTLDKDLPKKATESLFSTNNIVKRVHSSKHNFESDVLLSEISNGAMIAGIVERATSAAMHREIASKKADGITHEDIVGAIQQMVHENKDVSLDTDVEEHLVARELQARQARRDNAHA